MAILICERMKFEEAGYAFSEQTLWLHPDLAAGVYDTHESARGGAGRICLDRGKDMERKGERKW